MSAALSPNARLPRPSFIDCGRRSSSYAAQALSCESLRAMDGEVCYPCAWLADNIEGLGRALMQAERSVASFPL